MGTCAGVGDKNNYRQVAGAGLWGGKCTCPNGLTYTVGDNMDFCGSLACEGGISGACQKNIAVGGAARVAKQPWGRVRGASDSFLASDHPSSSIFSLCPYNPVTLA